MNRLVFAIAAATVVEIIVSLVTAPTATSTDQLFVVDDDKQQCGTDTYDTITAALADAGDGDVIKVCPGRYREAAVTVAKSVSIIGPVEAVDELDCAAATMGDLDLERVAVIEPAVATTNPAQPLMTLNANGVQLAGLVIQNVIDKEPAYLNDGTYNWPTFDPAVATRDDHSGYWIHDNLIRLSTLGVELGSSGATASRFSNNCLRQNRWGLANQREHLADAAIERNVSYGTEVFAYEIGWGLRETSNVAVAENRSVNDNTTFRLENSANSRISDNSVTAPLQYGITVLGGNGGDAGVRIGDNLVTATQEQLASRPSSGPGSNPLGIALLTPSAAVSTRSRNVVVESNIVSGLRTPTNAGSGLGVAAGAATGVIFRDNVLNGNGRVGLWIRNGNRDNLIVDNIANNNAGDGLWLEGSASTGNRFEDNRMSGNGGWDARDDTDPAIADGLQILGTWIDNKCQNDSPDGLCQD